MLSRITRYYYYCEKWILTVDGRQAEHSPIQRSLGQIELSCPIKILIEITGTVQ